MQKGVSKVFLRMITGIQIRAAMGVLNWSVRKLAEESGLGTTVLTELIKTDGVKANAKYETLKKVHDTLNSALSVFGIALVPDRVLDVVNSQAEPKGR